MNVHVNVTVVLVVVQYCSYSASICFVHNVVIVVVGIVVLVVVIVVL